MSEQTTAREKTINIIIAVVMIAIAAVMAVIGYQILPENVVTQPAAFDTGAPDIPRIAAVLFPFALSTLFAVNAIKTRKSALICLVGYGLNILLWVTNL